MPHTRLDDRLSVAAQLLPEGVADAAAQGFRLLICNRPDGEAEGQPSADTIAAAARHHGLGFVHLPVVGGAIRADTIEAFRDAVAKADGPVLAFCRSGMRSTLLWALGEARHRPVDAILDTDQAAGFDLSAQRATLELAASLGKPDR